MVEKVIMPCYVDFKNHKEEVVTIINHIEKVVTCNESNEVMISFENSKNISKEVLLYLRLLLMRKNGNIKIVFKYPQSESMSKDIKNILCSELNKSIDKIYALYGGNDVNCASVMKVVKFLKEIDKMYTESMIYPVIIELISNIILHAYNTDENKIKWLLYTDQDKIIIVDIGFGIANTIRNKTNCNMKKDAILIQEALDGTWISNEYRQGGFGLPLVKETINKVNYLKCNIISSKGEISFSEKSFDVLESNFSVEGTIVTIERSEHYGI